MIAKNGGRLKFTPWLTLFSILLIPSSARPSQDLLHPNTPMCFTPEEIHLSATAEKSAQNIRVIAEDHPTSPLQPQYIVPGAKSIQNDPKKRQWTPEYDRIIEQALPEEMLSVEFNPKAKRDIKRVCPMFFKGSRELRTQFWLYLFQSISWHEDEFNPRNSSREKDKDRTLSQGLMQVSYTDAPHEVIYVDARHKKHRKWSEGHGCDFDIVADRKLDRTNRWDATKTIFDPKRNLECGVKIMRDQLFTAKDELFPAKVYYWSTMTHGSHHYPERVFKDFNRAKHLPAFCWP
jgi:hypothetical protein